MEKDKVLLDTYPLQKDLRIRLPKQVLANLQVSVGTMFNIYINPTTNEIILKVASENENN